MYSSILQRRRTISRLAGPEGTWVLWRGTTSTTGSIRRVYSFPSGSPFFSPLFRPAGSSGPTIADAREWAIARCAAMTSPATPRGSVPNAERRHPRGSQHEEDEVATTPARHVQVGRGHAVRAAVCTVAGERVGPDRLPCRASTRTRHVHYGASRVRNLECIDVQRFV